MKYLYMKKKGGINLTKKRGGDMKPNPSKTKRKSINLKNKLSNITRLRKKKSESNLYADM